MPSGRPARAAGSGRPLWRVARRGIAAHRFRLVSTMVAVLLGVSFMSGTAVLGDTVESSFDDLFVEVYGRIDVLARSDRQLGEGGFGQRDRLDASVAHELATAPGVAAAEGEIEGQLRILDSDGRILYDAQAGPPPLALNWLETPALNRWELVDGRAPGGAGEVVLDQRSADAGGYEVGDTVGLVVRSGRYDATLVGIATYGGGSSYSGAPAVLMETATAQGLVGEPGRFDWVSVVAEPDVTAEALAARLSERAPEGVEVVTGAAFLAERQDVVSEFVSLFTQLISGFGLLALFVGAFTIYNTFTIIVAQRTRELALMRAVGATRRQVLRSVVGEAAMVGIIAACVGAFAGWGVAALLRSLIETFGFQLPETALVVRPARFVIPILLGIAVTVLSAVVPAWRAARTPPVAALRQASFEHRGHPWWRLLVAVPFVVASILIALYSFGTDSDLAPAYALASSVPVIIALAIAGPVLVPPLVAGVGSPLPALAGITGLLAQRNAVRNPSRTSSTAIALVIGISLVCVISVAAASISATVSQTVERTSFGDLVVNSDGGLGIAPSVAGQVAEVPGVAAAAGVRAGPVLFGRGAGVPDREFAIAVDVESAQRIVDLQVAEGSLAALGPDTVAIASEEAVDEGIAVGDVIQVGFLSTGTRDVTVVARYDRSLTRGGELLFSQDGWDPNVPQALRSDWRVLVALEPGADSFEVATAVERELAGDPTLEVLDVAELRDRQARQVVERLSFLYALVGLALLIGLLGIVNTLLLSVHERTRELGLLRAVGALRRQLSVSVLQEAFVIATLGAVLGVALGIVVGWVTVQTLTFGQAVIFSPPIGALMAIGIGACVAGVLAGIYPALRAGRLHVLQAVAYE